MNLQRLVEYRHSFFPVCDGSLSDLVGILNVSKVLHAYIKGEPIDLAALTQDGSLLPETLNGLELLNHFRTHSEHMVLVWTNMASCRGWSPSRICWKPWPATSSRKMGRTTGPSSAPTAAGC
ncbi:hypothetical protein [Aeromonas caviae]|uniref:hypothetical protein n=1 Tax=Aeromonas caviae TaxID=648 RepID=UPI000AE9BC5F|nr:hypothetical protein [Aeromonas caviae]